MVESDEGDAVRHLYVPDPGVSRSHILISSTSKAGTRKRREREETEGRRQTVSENRGEKRERKFSRKEKEKREEWQKEEAECLTQGNGKWKILEAGTDLRSESETWVVSLKTKV